MNYWRMSFRYGTGGDSVLDQCIDKGIAAVGEINIYGEQVPDLRGITKSTFSDIWKEGEYTSVTGRIAISSIRYSIAAGDVIYAKENTEILCCGTVTSEYDYDPTILQLEVPWPHYVRVKWDLEFKPIYCLLGAERITILRLNEARISELKRVLEKSGQSLLVPPPNPLSVLAHND